jgi:rod shape-determining protein MreD
MAVSARRPRFGGTLGEIGVTRVVAVAVTMLVAVALQSTLLAQLTILGVIPQLVLVVLVSFAYVDGERVGIVTGFFAGLLVDLLSPQSIMGLHALVYTMIGFLVGRLRQYMPGESVWVPLLTVAAATAIAEASYAVLSIIMGQTWVSFAVTARIISLVVLYNTLLTPLAFPIVRKVANRFRPERVYRW